MQSSDLICLLADERAAPLYRADALDAADRARLAASPALAGRTDWLVSRFLKRQAAGRPVRSLSHSRGAAAVLCGGAGVSAAGADIEYMRPRDFAALAGWVASDGEKRLLAARGWQTEDFYLLWTLKEALLKATGLAFPQDMRRVGWADGEGTRLHADGAEGWHGVSTKVGGRFMLSCVWSGGAVFGLEQPAGEMEIEVVRHW